jgi:hypothetical protein
VPKEVNGRAVQGAELLTRASADVREEPAAVLRAKPLFKNSSLVVPPMVASKRLPASRLAPLSTGCPLYQSLAVPELCPAPKQVRRAETLMLNWAPEGALTGPPVRARGIVFRSALLKLVPPPPPYAPTTAVSPTTATERPKKSNAAASLAVSFCC